MSDDEHVTPEQMATVERAIMRLDAEADAWMAEAPEFTASIQIMARMAPAPFQSRVASQIDAMIRNAFCEAFYRGFNAHRDLAEARSALAPEIKEANRGEG